MSPPSVRYCHACDAERSFDKPVVDHRTHLIATILSAGLWGVGWLAMTLHARMAPWQCRTCKLRDQDRWDRLTLIGSGTPTRATANR